LVERRKAGQEMRLGTEKRIAGFCDFDVRSKTVMIGWEKKGRLLDQRRMTGFCDLDEKSKAVMSWMREEGSYELDERRQTG
jgi:hypothetical protein